VISKNVLFDQTCEATEEGDQAGKPKMAREFWTGICTERFIERAAHILD
jgi:hypothetical protein